MDQKNGPSSLTVVSVLIAVENERAELFSSGTVSWRHGQLERDFLAALYEA
jgi:hypothetical protein